MIRFLSINNMFTKMDDKIIFIKYHWVTKLFNIGFICMYRHYVPDQMKSFIFVSLRLKQGDFK